MSTDPGRPIRRDIALNFYHGCGVSPAGPTLGPVAVPAVPTRWQPAWRAVPAALVERLRGVCERAGVPLLLDQARSS